MEWEDFKKSDIDIWNNPSHILTSIKCPDCGKYVYLDNTQVLTSYPAQYFYFCPCGWYGYSHIKWQAGMGNDE